MTERVQNALACECGGTFKLVEAPRKHFLCACGIRLMYTQGLTRIREARMIEAAREAGEQAASDVWLPDLD